jgi:putative addiction module CopG family antidote
MIPDEVLMTVSLSKAMEKFVAAKVRAGQYRSADKAVNALLAETAERERLSPEDVSQLRAQLDPAIAEADRGEFVEFTAEQIIAEARSARGIACPTGSA